MKLKLCLSFQRTAVRFVLSGILAVAWAASTTLFALEDETALVAEAANEQIRIGVLAKRGYKRCLENWNPMAGHLTKQIQGYTFSIIPLDFDECHKAVDRGAVDFILVNSSLYVDLEVRSKVMRIATLKNRHTDGTLHKVFAGVLFCRADRNDIQNARDLRNKTFMAVDKRSFGGWQMVWRELLEQEIDPYRHFSEIRYGGTHDAVVYAVRDGKVDAGTVRCGTLEKMVLEGEIKLDDFRVLMLYENDRKVGFGNLRSTRCYPEWPLAKSAGTTDDLAAKVTAALVQMNANGTTDQPATHTEWTIPQNYQSVHECLKALRIAPYEDYGKVTFGDVLRKYRFWLLGVFVLITLVFVSVICTYRLKGRLALAASKSKQHDKLIAILGTMKDGVYMASRNYDIQYVNPALENIFGKVGGKKCYEYLHNLDAPCSFCNNEQVFAGKTVYWERTDTQNGKTYDILEAPIKNSDGSISKVTILSDITERKQAVMMLQQSHDELEKKVAERTVDLEEANIHLKDLDKLKSMFIASMSHELRTPLNSIIGFSGLLLQGLSGDLNAEQQDSMERIHRSGNHLLELISDVIDISKIEAGHIDVFCEKFSLKDVVEESIDNTRPQAEAKGIALELHADGWPEMHTDRRRLLQCLLNFMSNAVKYSEKGKVTVSVTTMDDLVEIKVKDTGIGIPPDDMGKLFSAFERLESHLKIKAGGTGLGLYLTRKIAKELLHGSVSVESRAGEGSVFGVKIPVSISGEKK